MDFPFKSAITVGVADFPTYFSKVSTVTWMAKHHQTDIRSAGSFSGFCDTSTSLTMPKGDKLVNFGHPLANESETLRGEPLIMPNGKEVRQNEREPFFGILSSAHQHHLANPSGTVTVHLIHAKNLDVKTVQRIFSTSSCLNYYVRIDFLEKKFFSQLSVDVSLSDTQVVFDHVITFSVDDIAINEGSEMQIVVFNLIAVDETDPQKHIMIGKAEKPLLNFIREMVASEILKLTRPARSNKTDGGFEGERAMGTMLIKSAFAYGRFGYGYSNQIFDDRMEPSDAIKHSIFPRYATPSGRTQEAGRVLRFRPIRPLDISPLNELDAYVGNPLLRIDPTKETEEDLIIQRVISWMNPSLQYIPTLVKGEFEGWRQKMNNMKGCTTQRLAFLRQICTALPTKECSTAAVSGSPQPTATVSGHCLDDLGLCQKL